MKFGLIFVCVTLAWYGICTFISMNPNVMDWGIDGRFAFVALDLGVGTFVALMIRDILE